MELPAKVNLFGIVHQHGGCGTEALGAIELLRSRGVAVRCIVPPDDPVVKGAEAAFLRSIGVEVVNYQPGIFKSCDVLVSFAEGHLLFPLIEKHNDRPGYLVYSDCMHYASDDEIRWHANNLIDAFLFQTQALSNRLGPEIARRAKKSVCVRKGYKAFINPYSRYFPLRFSLNRPQETFVALKVCRDDPDKWHQESWRMFCGINGPATRKVEIRVVGWGDKAREKIGDLEGHSWSGWINARLDLHVHDPADMANVYREAHALIHVCDYEWEEALGRVILEAIVAGVVVIADNRGGARELLRHGETGFLVDSADEAAYYASKLAFDDSLRRSIAAQAYAELISSGHGNAAICWKWWGDLIKSTHIKKAEPNAILPAST